MKDLLTQVQDSYPDSHVGQRWAPARLGGTAPTPEQVEIEWAEHLLKQEREKAKNEEKA